MVVNRLRRLRFGRHEGVDKMKERASSVLDVETGAWNSGRALLKIVGIRNSRYAQE
jgi:hypothetical protein